MVEFTGIFCFLEVQYSDIYAYTFIFLENMDMSESIN